jgi:large subunit ribosomal protein L23
MAEKKQEIKASKEELLKAYDILKHPLITEKAVGFIETENKLSFIVDKYTSKEEIKKAVEDLFQVKVIEVNTLKDSKNRKKAFVRLTKEFKASDIATKLGVL